MLRTTDVEFVNMKAELGALVERIDNLDNLAMRSRKSQVPGMTLDDIHLMEEQLKHMRSYRSVLSTRIARVEGGI